MADLVENGEDISPYTLLSNFSRNRLLSCMFAAIMVHFLIIGGLSTNYIFRASTDTPAVDENDRNADAEKAKSEQPSSEPRKDHGTPPDKKSVDSATKGAKQPPVVGRVTDKPNPAEIPEEPGGLGLPFDGLDKN